MLSAGMLRLRQKFFLILFGLISIFLLLEVGLRFSGWIYYLYRIKNITVPLDNGDTIRILCLGDSNTFGIGAPKGYSYPEQLQRMLNNNSSKKFIVFNGGIPGSNSSNLYNNLENNIQRYNPNIIIVLVGSNDDSNFMQSNYFLFVNKSSSVYLHHLDSLLSDMRSYKFLKAIVINFYSKIGPKMKLRAAYSLGDDEILKLLPEKVDKNTIKKVPQELIDEMEKCLELGELYLSQTKINLAIAEFKKANALNPYDDRPYYMLGLIYLHYSAELGLKDRHALGEQEFKKAIEINPFNIAAHTGLFNTYYRTGKKILALEELSIIHRLNPNEEWVSRILTYGLPDIKDTEIFNKLLRYNLQNIIALITSKKIKIIIQNYPGNWQNECLRQIAKINKLPFVDNEIVFKRLKCLDGYKQQDYFAEDGHPNANGYRVIANNVYRVLKSEIQQ
jgi:lysophospholipase L1-like esterase